MGMDAGLVIRLELGNLNLVEQFITEDSDVEFPTYNREFDWWRFNEYEVFVLEQKILDWKYTITLEDLESEIKKVKPLAKMLKARITLGVVYD